MLPNDAAGTQISYEQFEKIGLGRILGDFTTVDVLPHVGSGASGALEKGSNNGEMSFVIVVDPLNKQADHIITG